MSARFWIGVGLGAGALLWLSRAYAGTLPRDFDHIFLAECRGIPVEYMRALAWNESRMQVREDTQGSRGLLQIVEEVRTFYNRRHGTSHSRAALFDPRINTRMACWTLGIVIRTYRTHNPRVFPSFDWRNRNHVQLLTQGWNSGFSEVAGVSRVISQLEAEGVAPEQITVDAVKDAAARMPGISPPLQTRSTRWVKQVWADYRAE